MPQIAPVIAQCRGAGRSHARRYCTRFVPKSQRSGTNPFPPPVELLRAAETSRVEPTGPGCAGTATDRTSVRTAASVGQFAPPSGLRERPSFRPPARPLPHSRAVLALLCCFCCSGPISVPS
jgi:hypothetical protein